MKKRNTRSVFSMDWECLACGKTFDTSGGSVWNGVDDFDRGHRLAHVHGNIRGVDVESVAPIVDVPAEEVTALAEEARDQGWETPGN